MLKSYIRVIFCGSDQMGLLICGVTMGLWMDGLVRQVYTPRCTSLQTYLLWRCLGMHSFKLVTASFASVCGETCKPQKCFSNRYLIPFKFAVNF